ncbi:MAG: DUF4136 domain-containing protein [Lautropia sp.]|nr:DUF4136 domain-containing protein [Lautropia sp.]
MSDIRSQTGRRVAPRTLMAALLLGAAVLSGCASTVPGQLTTFSRQAETAWSGQRFVIEPEEGQRNSLEFSAHAQRVQSALQKHGLVPVADRSTAQLLVQFDYGSGGATTVSSQRSSGGFSVGFGGGYRSSWGLGVGIPIGGSSAGETLYRHQMQVRITQLTPSAGGARTGERVYESTLVTQSLSASVSPQVPLMIDAIFAEFPGANGKTREVQLPRAPEND